jgi:hypothetical protein
MNHCKENKEVKESCLFGSGDVYRIYPLCPVKNVGHDELSGERDRVRGYKSYSINPIFQTPIFYSNTIYQPKWQLE